MAPILRSNRLIRPIATVRSSIIQGRGQRLYGQSSYGGDGEVKSEDGRNKPTRDLEHPGNASSIRAHKLELY